MEKSKILEAVKVAYDAIDDKMGTDVVMLDISEVSVLADYFIIATGSNSNQLKAIADHLQDKLGAIGVHQRSMEGAQTARWILIDFGHIIVHLFHTEDREYYRLDKLWADGVQILPEELV